MDLDIEAVARFFDDIIRFIADFLRNIINVDLNYIFK